MNWVASREHTLTHPSLNGREEDLMPLCNPQASDSANLDHVAEVLVRTGVPPQEALMLLVPEAYRNHPDLMKNYPEVRARPSRLRASVASCTSLTLQSVVKCALTLLGLFWQLLYSYRRLCQGKYTTFIYRSLCTELCQGERVWLSFLLYFDLFAVLCCCPLR